jgi:2-polyprenyl-3-methyl-5-hydroxy-6-metoxy-1,4-benzoquinol methylase
MQKINNKYEIIDQGNERILQIGGKKYNTRYSKKIIDTIIDRKGIDRAPQYLYHKKERAMYLEPLFNTLNQTTTELRVLEVGCSSGHITEYLNEQSSVKEIYAFDVDKDFVDITRIKIDELNLQKVVSIKHLTNQSSLSLPYKTNWFDIVIVLAVVEHLPYENRFNYIDEYYRVMKTNGIIGFWDTPNRYFPYESHSIGLPFLQILPPQIAYIYSKLFRKKARKVGFPEFVRAGTGWRNSSYYELLPKTNMIDIQDVSCEFGYKSNNKIVRMVSKMLGVPEAFFTPSLNVVFKKIKDYEY